MRQPRVLLAIATVAGIACLASACGSAGGDGETTARELTEAAPSRSDAGEEPSSKGDGGQEPATAGGQERNRAGSARPGAGGVSSRSASFQGSRGPLGDLPEYGEEAGAGARGEAQRLLDRYWRAMESGDLGRACGYLSTEVLAQIHALRESEDSSGDWCADGLAAYLSMSTASVDFGDYIGLTVSSLRRKQDAAFALMHAGPEDLWMVLKRQGGDWKVQTLTPQQL